MLQNYYAPDHDQESKGVCQLATSNVSEENLSLKGTWIDNLYSGKTLTGQACKFIGVQYPFMATSGDA